MYQGSNHLTQLNDEQLRGVLSTPSRYTSDVTLHEPYSDITVS